MGDHCPQDRPGDIARISRCRDMETHGNGRTNKFLVIGFIHRIENCQWFSGGIFYRGDPCLDQFLLSFYKGTGSSFDSGYKGGAVASFIILILIWVPSRNLSFIISFLIALPVIYTNVLYGIENTNKELLEMAEVFRVSPGKRIWYIYMSETLPYLRAACSVSLGLCWKAGVAAEVIGIPSGSVGEKLYEAKIYLQTPELFAWTLTIILLSVWFEKIFLFIIDHVIRVE